MTKNLSRALALVSAALFLCVLPANAQSIKQTAGSNITVTKCDAHQHPVGTAGHPWIDPYGNYHPAANFPYAEGFLDVAYTNNAHVAAKEIDFGLVSRDWMIAVTRDIGTFAPGTNIDHEFSLDPQVFPIGTALPYCAVLRVKYADGTEWHNPNPPQQ